jgi:hypothetical protein
MPQFWPIDLFGARHQDKDECPLFRAKKQGAHNLMRFKTTFLSRLFKGTKGLLMQVQFEVDA